jgi:hypothetical protein
MAVIPSSRIRENTIVVPALRILIEKSPTELIISLRSGSVYEYYLLIIAISLLLTFTLILS